MEKLYKKLGNIIRNIRKQKNMSQQELAEKIGRSRSSIAYIETGKIGVSLVTLMEVADGLEVSLYDIFEEVDNNYKITPFKLEDVAIINQILKNNNILPNDYILTRSEYKKLIKFIENNAEFIFNIKEDL